MPVRHVHISHCLQCPIMLIILVNSSLPSSRRLCPSGHVASTRRDRAGKQGRGIIPSALSPWAHSVILLFTHSPPPCLALPISLLLPPLHTQSRAELGPQLSRKRQSRRSIRHHPRQPSYAPPFPTWLSGQRHTRVPQPLSQMQKVSGLLQMSMRRSAQW
jgi:hypothetical protein